MKPFLYIFFIIVISILFSSKGEAVFTHIESSAPSVLAAVLGGVLAAVAIIIGVLSTASDEVKKKANEGTLFSSFVRNLGRDIKILIFCLLLSLLLPMARSFTFPFAININGVSLGEYYPYLITSLEIGVLLLAFLIIFEIADVLISVLSYMMKINGDNAPNK